MWSFKVSLFKKIIDIKAEQRAISYFMLVEAVEDFYVFTNMFDVIGVFPKCFHWIQLQNICRYSQKVQTCHHLCKKPGCYHSANKTDVRDRIFKLSPIHVSVIYQIPWIHWI